MLTAGVSGATLSRVRATLQAALNGAARAGLSTENPASRSELLRAACPRGSSSPRCGRTT